MLFAVWKKTSEPACTMLIMLDWYTLLVWDDGTLNVYDMHHLVPRPHFVYVPMLDHLSGSTCGWHSQQLVYQPL